MQIISKLKNLFTRNIAFSNSYSIQTGAAQFKDWTIQKAVKDGYKVNSWVYRAVSLIAKSAASVPWIVQNSEGEHIDHYLADLIQYPNPSISRQDVFELIISWLELGGNAYLNNVKVGGKSTELWPVSPDRLTPVLSKNISEWIKGYALDQSQKVHFEPYEILHFKYFDPSNPYNGIGPLQAVSKTVDIDVDQLSWNKSAMQNRGVLDGVFSFKKEFRSQEQADAVKESLNERYAGGRGIGVIGSEAKYERTALTPVQMDFMASRQFNRDEIFIIFGIPPQYAGTQESSTYNNYQTSELIFWFQKIIPLLDDIKDTLNFFFKVELGPDLRFNYDLGKIPAIRRALLERSKTAKILFEMGVPTSQLNRIFEFGIEEFDGWDISHIKKDSQEKIEVKETSKVIETRKSTLLQKRSFDQEQKDREEFSIKKAKGIEILLGDQQDIIFDAIEKNATDIIGYINVEKLLLNSWSDWINYYNELTKEYAIIASREVILTRSANPDIDELISKYLEEESTVLIEKSLIEKTTVSQLIDQVEEGIESAWTTAQLQQAIVDIGVFSPERALRLSRTITGTSGSIGQFVGAKETGANYKKWINAGFEVRDLHIQRAAGPAIKINDRFPAMAGAFQGPMFPLDNVLAPSDRVNCRCAMSFEIR